MRRSRNKRAGRKFGAIETGVLQELSLGDLAYGFLLSAKSTPRLFRLARERATYRYRRKVAIERLLEDKLIQQRGEKLSLTSGGKGALDLLVKETRELLGKRRWDRKWRVVAFDIPETMASLRDKVRAVLKRTGFAQLQQSVWVFPHECEELVALIKHESSLAPHVLYGVLESIESDDRLRKTFKLS